MKPERKTMEWTRKDYVLTDDPERIDVDAVHTLLRDTYWARTRSREAVRAQHRQLALLWSLS
jgi:hypothetical protein